MLIGRGIPRFIGSAAQWFGNRRIIILSGLKSTDITVGLVGQAAVADVGSAFPGQVLDGLGATTALGMLSGGVKYGYLAWARLTIPLPGVTTFSAALTGLAGASAGGTFPLVNPKRAYLSWAKLQTPLSLSANVALIGAAGSGLAGSLTPVANSTVQQLTGQSCTSAAGDLAQGRLSLLVGIELASAGGSLGTSDDVFAVVGQAVPTVAVSATGAALMAQIGALVVVADNAVQVGFLVGQEAVMQLTPAVASTEALVPLSGLESSALAGTHIVALEATELVGIEVVTIAANAFLQGEIQLDGLAMTAIDGTLLTENSEWQKVPTQSSIWTPRPGNPATWT